MIQNPAARYTSKRKEIVCVCMLSPLFVFDSLQPMDYSPPGSSVCEIFQARILE